jgi:hypothetical protein
VDRAYPLAVLRDRGIINDRIGKRSVAIIYDADADHVIALDPRVGDEAIDLVPAHKEVSASPSKPALQRRDAPGAIGVLT